MLILRSYGNELAVNFLAPLRSLLNFDPETFASKFFDLRMAGFRFSFYYRGLNMDGEQHGFFFPETDELIDPFAGYLTVNVRTNRVFERQMELYSQKNPGYRFYTSRALENEFRDLQKADIAVFLYDPLSAEERPSSFTELLAVFSDMREVLRFRWQHPERGWLYSVIMPDAIFDDYVHLHEVPLSLFVRYDTLFHALRVLLLLLFIFGLIFIFVFPFVSRPLRSFAGLITKTGLDFSPAHTASFRPVFRELSLMKDSFCQRLERVNRHISLREGLLHIQSLIRDEVDRQSFAEAVNGYYQKYFNVGFKAYDPEADLLVLDGVSDAGGLSDGSGLSVEDGLSDEAGYSGEDGLSDEAGDSDVDDAYLTVEREPFDEQVRFYYQKEILEQEFLESLSQNREFELARQVQLSLLPRNVQNQDNYEISTFYLAARFLGGDFFEVIQSPEKSVFLIADVSGKGFGSSLFGAAVKSLFGAYYRKGLKLDEIFIALNTALIRHFHQQLFCTCFAAEKQGSRIEFCSAGHNNMYLVRKQEIITLWAEGLPFGLLEGYNYKSGSLELVDQDLLFLYTDGCNEAESAKKTLFGDDELQACVLRSSGASPELFNREMYAALSEHSRGAEQSDDITYIIVRFHLDKQGA
jgi:serine phosphatase RsbU (regulator of sigma subunit)